MIQFPRGFMGRSRVLHRFVSSSEALAITEYALLVAFAALALVGVVYIFGPQIASWFLARTGTITTV